MAKENEIVKNLIPSEPVKIIGIKSLSDKKSITYVGVNSGKSGNQVVSQSKFDSLEIISTDGTFNFSGNPQKYLACTEAERIASAYQFDPLFAVNCSIVDPLPHQVEAVYRYLLPLPKIRFLLADDTGAGKTIMAGLLLKEMVMRGTIEKILIVTPGGLTKQWQEDEMGIKFNFTFKIANRASFNAEPTIFSSERVIASIDFIRSEDVMNVLKDQHWDMVIVDEAHKLSVFEYGVKKYISKRYEVIQLLSDRCEHLLLLTATPHRGRKDTFKNLLQLLDKDIFTSDELVTKRIKEYEAEGINRFFIRRLKEDMKDWEGKPLFKLRYTKTVQYELTPEEKMLYDAVTDYLTNKRKDAIEQKNQFVELTLMVMQRRLTSSIYAITKTITNRYNALNGLLDELQQSPELLKKRASLADADIDNIDDYDELDDSEKETIESIMMDPKKFKLFTTAKSIPEIREEVSQVKVLKELAESMKDCEEQKYLQLKELLLKQGVLDKNEKLVIFTEHRDTLDYLQDKLSNQGYKIVTIHGGKNVDERRQAQFEFARGAQILIATDAAGEGINLQFCKLLINWDIPWNPNRLEQRMGRIHRYGQKEDVLVFNLVANNTREGKVLERLLSKLDIIRDQMGDDRVYDVISDIFEDVSLDDIFKSTFEGAKTNYNKVIDEQLSTENLKEKIKQQKERLTHSTVDYMEAKRLKDSSDEKRLQPIYIKMFFEKAFTLLGGKYSLAKKEIYQIEKIPEAVAETLKHQYKISSDTKNLPFCFDKRIFLEYQNFPDLGKVHYINPGNPLFDALVKTVREQFKEEMIKGTLLVSPDDKEPYFSFFVRNQITDDRKSNKQNESVTNELLIMVCSSKEGFQKTSPAKYIDLKPPVDFAKPVTPPPPHSNHEVINWSFKNITEPLLEDTRLHIEKDSHKREEYLRHAFQNLIIDLQSEVNELYSKLMFDPEVSKKITEKQARIEELKKRRADRLQELELMKTLSPKEPEVVGCAYVIPLSAVEYETHYGMSRDDEVEHIAMKVAMDYEVAQGWQPEDVSKNNEGYDIRSISKDYLKRYVEVKGRSAVGGIMLSENEMNRLTQLGDNAWLYIVVNCKATPELFRVQNPGKNLKYEMKNKGVQYFLALEEWKSKGIK